MEFKDPMLTVGTEPKPFVPQQRSIIAFETELAAHPVDGSNPDTLFMGDDGLPYVLEKWGKIALEPSNFENIAHNENLNGFKQISILLKQKDTSSISRLIKFDGTQLILDLNSAPLVKPDSYSISNKGNVWVTIPNSDSGWGADYTPTQDEIKAYFLGWRMFEWGLWNNQPNNRTDGLEKAWVQIGETNYSSPDFTTRTVPTTMATAFGYTPYRLHYLRAKPTVEPVRNYELGATLFAGSNMVEVGDGIVIREKANPVTNLDGWTYINTNYPGLDSSKLKNITKDIFGIYEGGSKSDGWIINNIDAYGKVRAARKEGYDPTAVYHVTYTMLDPTLAAPISGTVAANLRGTVSDLVQDVGDIGRRLSVVENSKEEKDSPPWITPTLLNGWVSWGERWTPPQYYKDDNGIVHLRGLVKGGVIDSGKAMFVLPQGYRPSHSSAYVTYSQGASQAEVNGVLARIDVSGETGSVYPTRGSNELFSLEGISFRAER
ncbi:hypothetical protein ABU162_13235 [Paenibacillus thiaminolyticus]|uniref:hypothetical protein n=1 Tax=Paenibacillus thiaminolyticus TaxID=49283 RepID=UPI0035A6384F